MEASVVVVPDPQPTYDGEAEATRSVEELFQWSMYVHVGADAEACSHREDGKCADPQHFHAWVCLPNAFQIRDISEKAQAAWARKKRALRDPESDSYAVLEDALADRRRDQMDDVIDGAAKANVNKRLPEIIESIKQDERFEHQAQDAEEFRRLGQVPEDERDPEEFDRLAGQVKAYADRFEEIVAEQEEREREALRNDHDRAVDVERQTRIDATAREVYMHVYYTWAMYTGTRKPVSSGFPLQRKFHELTDLKSAPPEVVDALREALRELEDRTTVRSDAAGNS